MRIFSVMEQNNYFDKFMKDLAEREEKALDAKQQIANAQEMWEKRQQLDQNYREHPDHRIRYSK